MKNIWFKINEFCNKNWVLFLLGIITLFIVQVSIHMIKFEKNGRYFVHMHHAIFLISLVYFIFLYFKKPSVLLFVIPILIVEFVDFHHQMLWITHFIFQQKIVQKFSQHIVSKDINVILIFIFSLLLMVNIPLLFYQQYKRKKMNLSLVFSTITIVSYIITTLMFHYFLIEKNYHNILNLEMSHMQNIIQNSHSKNEFFLVCQNQEYICSDSKKEIIKQINNPIFTNLVLNVHTNQNQIFSGNFPIGDADRNVLLIVEIHNLWVINPTIAKITFAQTELYVIFCLTIAHGVWILFFIWLNLFHYRKKNKHGLINMN
jgi:hypothetical protein